MIQVKIKISNIHEETFNFIKHKSMRISQLDKDFADITNLKLLEIILFCHLVAKARIISERISII